MDIEFHNVYELYKRVYPALESKTLELKRYGLNYLKEEDVWNFLKTSKWKNSNNLALYEMVSDILNTDNYLIDDYFKNQIKEQKRELYLDS